MNVNRAVNSNSIKNKAFRENLDKGSLIRIIETDQLLLCRRNS